MTEEQLVELEALANAATPGPWRTGPEFHDGWRSAGPYSYLWRENNQRLPDSVDGALLVADSAFIAASREAVPALIAEVRRLRDLVEKSGVPHTITVNGEERLYWPLPKDATTGEP